jgi:hypothetical protein
MSPFEALYCRKCNTPVSWDNPTDKTIDWARFVKGNGRVNDKDKAKFEGFPIGRKFMQIRIEYLEILKWANMCF